MEVGKVVMKIERTLSQEERDEVARKHVRLTDKHDKLVEEFKDDRAVWRSKIKECKTERDETGKAYMTGSELVDVETVATVNMDKKVMEFIHLGAVIKTRELTAEEIEQFGSKPMFDEPESAHEDIGHVRKSETKRSSKKDIISGVN